MPSGLSLDQKKSFITGSLMPMLANDLHRVIDSTCSEHGRPGPGPNFTAALICMVACEVLGRLSSPPHLADDDAAIDFIRRLTEYSKDPRYERAAPILWVYFRHGPAHSFLPKLPGHTGGAVAWAQNQDESGVCVDFLGSASGALALAEMRRSGHLVISQNANRLIVVPQVLYVDILRAMTGFKEHLETSGNLSCFEEGFEKWYGRLVDKSKSFAKSSREYFVNPPSPPGLDVLLQ